MSESISVRGNWADKFNERVSNDAKLHGIKGGRLFREYSQFELVDRDLYFSKFGRRSKLNFDVVVSSCCVGARVYVYAYDCEQLKGYWLTLAAYYFHSGDFSVTATIVAAATAAAIYTGRFVFEPLFAYRTYSIGNNRPRLSS